MRVRQRPVCRCGSPRRWTAGSLGGRRIRYGRREARPVNGGRSEVTEVVVSGVQAGEPGRLSWSARVGFTALAVVAFVLGMVGFRQYLPAHPEYGSGVLDLVYYSLQLFVLDAAAL